MGCTLCPPTGQIHPVHKHPIYSHPSLLFFPQSSPQPTTQANTHLSPPPPSINPLNPNTSTSRPTQQPISRFKGRLHRSLYLSITNNSPKCEMAPDHHAPVVTSPVLPHQQCQDLPDLCSMLSHSHIIGFTDSLLLVSPSLAEQQVSLSTIVHLSTLAEVRIRMRTWIVKKCLIPTVYQ